MSISETTSIRSFITSSMLISVPRYQRNYSWTEKQLSEFWDDVESVSINSSGNPVNRHFFGLIVLVTIDNETKQYEVVDGQQRLTTIKLLLSAIRDTAAEIRKLNQDQRISSNIEKLNANINSLLFSNPHTYSKYERRFVPNSHDQDVYQYITYYLPGEDHEIEHAITKLFNSSPEFKALDSKIDFLKSIKIWNSARHFRSFKAYKFFSEKISESVFGKSDSEKIQFLIDLVAKCADGLQLMIFSSSNEAEAFNLFETLNDRGLGLAAVDLIKNKVLQRTNEQYRDDVAKKWDEIFGNNGYVDAGSHNLFLRHYYNCQYDFITKQGIYSGYSAIIAKLNTPDKLNQWILELNTSASDFYQFKNVIIDGKAFFAENAELQNIFLLLKKTGSVQWYTLAFSLLKVYRENPELKIQIIRALWLTLNLILRFMLLNEKFNKIETKIPKIARSIWDKAKYPIFDEGSEDQEYFESNYLAVCYACEQLEKLIAKYVPDEILYPDASYKDSPIYKDIDDNNLANTLLRIIALKKGPSGFSPKLDLTLEHILPIDHKKWSPDVSGFEPEQAKKISDDFKSVAESVKYKIGNMVLITGELNSSIKNARLEDKLIEYKKKNIFDIVEVNQVISYTKSEDWSKLVVNERSKHIASVLVPILLDLNHRIVI